MQQIKAHFPSLLAAFISYLGDIGEKFLHQRESGPFFLVLGAGGGWLASETQKVTHLNHQICQYTCAQNIKHYSGKKWYFNITVHLSYHFYTLHKISLSDNKVEMINHTNRLLGYQSNSWRQYDQSS